MDRCLQVCDRLLGLLLVVLQLALELAPKVGVDLAEVGHGPILKTN